MKTQHRMKPSARCLACLCIGLLAGCATGVPVETRLAGVVSQFQKSAGDFTATRRSIARDRQALIDATEDSAAASRDATDAMVGSWKLADDQERLRLHTQLVANAQAAGEAALAFEQLRATHDKALDDAGTKVKFRDAQLSATINALTSLGTKQSIGVLFDFYFAYAKDTMTSIEKLKAEAATKPADAKSATTPTATTAPRG